MVGGVIEAAIAAGELKKGMSIVEASSGNTGTALARVAKEKGFSLKIFLADTVSQAKQAAIRRFGAEIELVNLEHSPDSEIDLARKESEREGVYFFNQFENRFHVEAYKKTLLKELLSQLQEQEITIDAFVSGVGSGASNLAIGQGLREAHNSKLAIYSVVPKSFPTDIEGLNPGHISRNGHFKIWRERPQNFERQNILVDDSDAFSELLSLEEKTGILVGPASGAALFAARNLNVEGNLLVLFTDSGEKYKKRIGKWRQLLAKP